MNGNYEFVKQVAQDKQSAFIQEARAHRLAKLVGGTSRSWPELALFVRTGAWLQRAVGSVALRAAVQVASWKAVLRGPGAAAH